MVSLGQRFWNLNSRMIEKPLLWAVRDQARMRKIYDVVAPLTYRRFSDMRFSPVDLVRKECSVSALWCDRGYETSNRLIFYIHGGGFCIGSPETHCRLIAGLAGKAKARGLAIRYRLAPEHPFPVGLEDITTAYQAVLDQGWASDNIILAGDSAGGNLVLGLLQKIEALGLRAPAGAICIAPATDLSAQSPSLRINRHAERVIPAAWLRVAVKSYLPQGNVTDPLASPVFGTFTGTCPVFLSVGAEEVLRDDSRRMRDRLRECGVDVSYEEIAHVHHVWPLRFGWSAEANSAVDRMAAFAETCLGHRD
ncbi:MAG: alpha/beta hydrolase [Pseudoruegeria sp.]